MFKAPAPPRSVGWWSLYWLLPIYFVKVHVVHEKIFLPIFIQCISKENFSCWICSSFKSFVHLMELLYGNCCIFSFTTFCNDILHNVLEVWRKEEICTCNLFQITSCIEFIAPNCWRKIVFKKPFCCTSDATKEFNQALGLKY